MDKVEPNLPILRPEEKVIGTAYVTEDGEIVFTRHSNTTEVVLVAAQPGVSGPWAVRVRPAESARPPRAAPRQAGRRL